MQFRKYRATLSNLNSTKFSYTVTEILENNDAFLQNPMGDITWSTSMVETSRLTMICQHGL